MARTILFCSGVFLLSTTYISGQTLPKHPTAQQVVGYRMMEQQRWNSQQLPRNSVLYNTDRKYPGWQSFHFSFKKAKRSAIDLSSIRSAGVLNNERNFSSLQLPFLKANLMHQKQLYRQWQKESLWKDFKGSNLLRDFLISSKNRNSFQL